MESVRKRVYKLLYFVDFLGYFGAFIFGYIYYSSFCYLFPLKNFLSTVLRPWFRNPYTVFLKIFHLSLLRVPPGSVRIFLIAFRLVLPSPGFLGALASSCGSHSMLLETKACRRLSPVNPTSFPFLRTNELHEFPLSTPAHIRHSPFASRSPLSHYRFLVMILHLSLFRIQTFHGAHTDTSFLHAAILRTSLATLYTLHI